MDRLTIKQKEDILKEKYSIKDFKNQYLCEYTDTIKKNNSCGECIFFDGKCTTSYLEAKWGNSNTPACSDFKKRDNS